MVTIARIQSDFPTKFGIPRQSGLAKELQSWVKFESEFSNPDVVRGLEQFSHIWLLWEFSEHKGRNWSATVRPPRLGGNERLGVFATRSPFRPNPIGLSLVKLEEIVWNQQGLALRVSGADLMDGTPIYDIKPYLPHLEAVCDANGGFAQKNFAYKLEVVCDKAILQQLPEDKQSALLEILSEDPRPSYHNDPERVYGFRFSDYEIRFVVNDLKLTVLSIDRM